MSLDCQASYDLIGVGEGNGERDESRKLPGGGGLEALNVLHCEGKPSRRRNSRKQRCEAWRAPIR